MSIPKPVSLAGMPGVSATGIPESLRASRPVIQARDVNKVYASGTVALQDATLDIREGEFVSLLGPSGCGKSTLLRIMAGLGDITAGSVKWWEQDYSVVGDKGRKLAFVFQSATLMPWARVEDNVRLPLDLEQVKSAEAGAKVQKALDMVGLAKFGQSFPRELSGGMQMRASIARALVTEPDLLLMDEPFGALDEMTRNKLNDDILRLWQANGWTIVFVTHSVYEAVYLSSRVVVMAARPGRIVEEITIDEPFPRGADFRVSQSFAGYCRRVSESLEKASAMGADGQAEEH
ncbi:ABC transporter ATP-binding protein [Thalassolituus sp. LLYu03]|uniref:ABC transporter ATP-binding protein n=1 Tax=Thalassolituus sp. LLYu03 TaxID=3421656 RepID=UPI003D29CBBB